MLEAKGLVKAYGGKAVVDGVSLRVEPGEIVGLLGPNGAGKSTTVAMLCGLVAPEAGSVSIAGSTRGPAADPRLKRRIGLVPQDLSIYEDRTARANLRLFGALYGLGGERLNEACEAALALVGLADRAGDRPATFSGGMKRRLNIACALVHDPDVLVFDEPTVGVDPQSRNAIFDNLEQLRDRGKALLYTTHYMEEAERLCERVVIVDHGRVVASDRLQALYRGLPASGSLAIEVEGPVDLQALARQPGIRQAVQDAGGLRLGVEDLGEGLASATAWLTSQGHAVRGVSSGRADLEDVFLALTGRQLRD